MHQRLCSFFSSLQIMLSEGEAPSETHAFLCLQNLWPTDCKARSSLSSTQISMGSSSPGQFSIVYLGRKSIYISANGPKRKSSFLNSTSQKLLTLSNIMPLCKWWGSSDLIINGVIGLRESWILVPPLFFSMEYLEGIFSASEASDKEIPSPRYSLC